MALTVIEDTSMGPIVAAVTGGTWVKFDLVCCFDAKVVVLGSQTVGGRVGSVADGSEWAGQAPSLVAVGRSGEQGVGSNPGQFFNENVM